MSILPQITSEILPITGYVENKIHAGQCNKMKSLKAAVTDMHRYS